ncbi:Ribonucleotide reductase of class III (anaerobic), activating protein [Rubrivivax sp. A210]|uniref:anaerobic ribonucleoside-triphosphate reductase activating protein n=1 Tax=Rubrivivax sp. A210 TaxID=2772301 RepID=UPI0019B64D21|nr:anaerobic ribonucleoside-triphosphate reductase activating protein [Rubrivivax sp. A210]CAD5373104.1 Ribonucleotide reductase of class III (anaerobic), activating protein [Rubrivivax sp. A210]
MKPSPTLEVGGFTPLSTTDWPGRLAAVVFVQGCPWACGYCHNPELRPRCASRGPSWPEVLETLTRRVGLLDGVVFSGGEPTLDPGLGAAIEQTRTLGFQIGLHTAGIYPERLARLLPQIDWVGLDLKTEFGDYDEVTGRRGSATAARRALELLLASGIAHELRTTYDPALVSDEALRSLARLIKSAGARDWVIQRCRSAEGVDKPLPKEALLQALRRELPELSLRAV